AFDIHPTAPLWGKGELRSTGQARALELAALEGDTARRLRDGLEAAGLKQERRATRLRPSDLAWDSPEAGALRLFFGQAMTEAGVRLFGLPPGAYATSVLAELGEAATATDAR
ncbi:MAG TPA: hypothetical protein PLD19_11425, partial [Luteimonas sp.]|nr:hypothetical protein [Luteimonas sp.]